MLALSASTCAFTDEFGNIKTDSVVYCGECPSSTNDPNELKYADGEEFCEFSKAGKFDERKRRSLQDNWEHGWNGGTHMERKIPWYS